jgi:hypothetical protein
MFIIENLHNYYLLLRYNLKGGRDEGGTKEGRRGDAEDGTRREKHDQID